MAANGDGAASADTERRRSVVDRLAVLPDRARLVARRLADRLRERAERLVGHLRHERGRDGHDAPHRRRSRTTRTRPGRPTEARSRSHGTATSTRWSADGSTPTRISDVLVEESDPAWSPDGELDRLRPPDAGHGDPERLGHARRRVRPARADQAGRTRLHARVVAGQRADRLLDERRGRGVRALHDRRRRQRPAAASHRPPATTSSRPGRRTGRRSPIRRPARSSRSSSAAATSRSSPTRRDNDSSPAWNPQPPPATSSAQKVP